MTILNEVRKYYPNGQLHYLYYVDDNNMRQGEYTSWYNNGELHAHLYYVNGLTDGEYKSWYSNGQMRRHCHYVNGGIHGEHKWWEADGTLTQHQFYSNGEDIAEKIKTIVADISDITEEEKAVVALTYGIVI